MSKKYILSIDQGTTSTRAMLVDENFRIVGSANKEFSQHYPNAGWVEHDLNEIWSSVQTSVRGLLDQIKINPKDIAAIGITNQRETTCIWEKNEDAKPLHRAIVWQDRRTADRCNRLKKQGVEKEIRARTGLCLDPYFSSTKLEWLLKQVEGLRAAASKGSVAFGTIESFLLYKITRAHVTEPSNASRTMLMNLKSCQWDEQMLKLFKVPAAMLAEIRPSAVEYGRTKGFADLPDGIPVTGMAGDQQAALFGQACFAKGAAKATYGTGAFVLANIGKQSLLSKNKLLTSVAWKLGNHVTYCLEGSAFIAGAAVQWLRDGLGIIKTSSEMEALASSVEDADGVVFVPALAGLGAPHWLSGATGMITGITRRTSKAHVARATLEGIAFQVRELVEAMAKDYGKIKILKVDGGASANNMLMQFQSDLLNLKVVRSGVMETTALGAAFQAGLGVGLWTSLEEIEKKWQAAQAFEPKMSPVQRKRRIMEWERAVGAVQILST